MSANGERRSQGLAAAWIFRCHHFYLYHHTLHASEPMHAEALLEKLQKSRNTAVGFPARRSKTLIRYNEFGRIGTSTLMYTDGTYYSRVSLPFLS